MSRFSLDETKELLRAWRMLGNQDAYSLLIADNIGLVKKIANKFWNKDLLFDDLLDAGLEGLEEAINKIDFENAELTSFSTFMWQSITWKILKVVNKEKKIRLNEISLNELMPNSHTASPSTYEEVLQYEQEFEFLRPDTQECMQDALQLLSPDERKVIILKYGFEDNIYKSDEEVGQILGVTKARIGQIKNKALARLRKPDALDILRGL